MSKIKNRFTGETMFESRGKTIRELVECKIKQNADLWNTDLSYANLSDSDLRNADLWNADLSYSNLSHANLSNSDLSNANLSYANLSNSDLSNANLHVKSPPIESHQFISEILYRQAETGPQLDFAARIRIQSGCKYNWKFFINLARKKKVLKWACKILFQWDEFKERFEKEGK